MCACALARARARRWSHAPCDLLRPEEIWPSYWRKLPFAQTDVRPPRILSPPGPRPPKDSLERIDTGAIRRTIALPESPFHSGRKDERTPPSRILRSSSNFARERWFRGEIHGLIQIRISVNQADFIQLLRARQAALISVTFGDADSINYLRVFINA